MSFYQKKRKKDVVGIVTFVDLIVDLIGLLATNHVNSL